MCGDDGLRSSGTVGGWGHTIHRLPRPVAGQDQERQRRILVFAGETILEAHQPGVLGSVQKLLHFEVQNFMHTHTHAHTHTHTQDTVVALQALATFAESTYSQVIDKTIVFNLPGLSSSVTTTITTDNRFERFDVEVGQTDTQIDRLTGRQTDRQVDRHTHRQTDKQMPDRQTDTSPTHMQHTNCCMTWYVFLTSGSQCSK